MAPGADEHVLAGARLFRESRYADALVEFQVADRLGFAQARGYVAASLLKLGRPLEALELFEQRAETRLPSDALLDYYHALACYDARLYLGADALLSRIPDRTGPRIAAQVAQIRAEIAAALKAEPRRDAVDWYLARAEEHARAGRTALARAFYREARALGERRRDQHAVATAEARLAELGGPRAGTR